MLYPLYVHKEAGSAYGGQFPDIPGCFTAADALEDLPLAAQEAVAAHFGIDDDALPAPSAPDAFEGHPDYHGGFWLLVNIDPDKVRSRAVRLNITLPEHLVQRVDALAKRRGQSRSSFLAQAAEHAIGEDHTPGIRNSAS